MDTILDRPYELTNVLPFRNDGYDREGRPGKLFFQMLLFLTLFAIRNNKNAE